MSEHLLDAFYNVPARGDAVKNQGKHENDLVKLVWNYFYAAKAYKQDTARSKDWDRYIARYLGNSKAETFLSSYVSTNRHTPSVNITREIIQRSIQTLGQNPPQYVAHPKDERSVKYVEPIKKLMGDLWRRNHMRRQAMLGFLDGHIIGTWFLYPYFDEQEREIAWRLVHPKHVFPSPESTDESDLEYLIFAYNISTAKVLRQYPHLKGYLQTGIQEPDLNLLQMGSMSVDTSNTLQTYFKPTDSQTGSTMLRRESIGANQALDLADRSVTCLEFWVRGKDGNLEWYKIINNVLAEERTTDEALPLIYRKEFPIVRFVNDSLTGNFWGIGEVFKLWQEQSILDRLMGQTLDIVRLTLNPILFLESVTGLKPNQLINLPNLVVRIDPGSRVHPIVPGRVDSAFFQLIADYKSQMYERSGIVPTVNAGASRSLLSAMAQMQLQENVGRPLELKARNYEQGLNRLAYLSLELMKEFYGERSVRILGEDGNPTFFSINSPAIGFGGLLELENPLAEAKLDLEVIPNSTLAQSEVYNFIKLLQLADRGRIDSEELLTASKHPNAEEVIMRMRSRKQLAEQRAEALIEQGAPDRVVEKAYRGSQLRAGGRRTLSEAG